MQRRFVAAVGALLVLAIGVGLYVWMNQKPSFQGAVITPPWPAPELQLVDHDGNPYRLSEARGKVVLMYFGYTNCPDECPLTMAHAKLAIESLGKDGERVQVVMVSTDPARDTPEALQQFMGSFGPQFIGLTGTQPELEKAWKDYGVAVEDGGETHSTYLYVVDPAGEIRETFQPDTQPEVLAGDVELLLAGK